MEQVIISRSVWSYVVVIFEGGDSWLERMDFRSASNRMAYVRGWKM